MATSKLKVVMFLGTVRDNRLGIRAAKFMKNYLMKTNHDVVLLDPLELDFPLLKRPVHFYKPGEAPAKLIEISEIVKSADAILIVSAEYNHCIPPALSNLLDHFGTSAYSWKPSAIVCYSAGQFGGMRAAMQMRSLLGELGCLSVSNIFGIPRLQNAINEEGVPQDDYMEKGAKKLIDQLDWHANAMKNHRENFGIPK